MNEMTIGRSLGGAIEWFEQAIEKHGMYLEDEFAFSITLEKIEHRYNVELSKAAILMLATPILERIEARELSQRVKEELLLPSQEVVEETLNKLIHGAANEPTQFDDDINTTIGGTPDEPGRLRATLSIIRQFWKKFCDIPPFCGDTSKYESK